MIRRILLAAALLPTTLVACGDDGGAVTPTGPFYHYAVDKAFMPDGPAAARNSGLDIDGKEGIDNQLGMVLGTLADMGFDLQTSIDDAINQGDINLLVSLQTPSFTSAGGAGVKVLLGENPSPAPCTDPNNPTTATCAQHLKGTGMFDVASEQAALTGKIVSGTMNAGPGDISLQISIAGATVNLDLIGGRAQASGMTEDKITSIIVAGAVTEDNLNNDVLPAIAAQLGPLIARDCTALDMPMGTPPCGCPDGSTGKQVVSLFDAAPKDCMVTVDEIKNNGLIMSLLAPDVNIGGVMALSVGLKVSTVKSTFTAPGE